MPRKKFYVFREHLGDLRPRIIGATSLEEAVYKAQVEGGLIFHRCPECGDIRWYLFNKFSTLKAARYWAGSDHVYLR